MNNITEIMDVEEFNQLLKSKKPILIDFFATWCAPCKMQAPILSEFSLEIGDKAKIVKVDVDLNPEIANAFGVQSIPTLVVYVDGKIKEKAVGLTTKASLSEMLIKYL